MMTILTLDRGIMNNLIKTKTREYYHEWQVTYQLNLYN